MDLIPEAQVVLPRYSRGRGCLDHSQNLVIFLSSQMVHSKGSATSGWRQTRIIGNSTIQLSEMREKLINNSSALGPDRISKKALLNWDPECKQIGRLSTK